jgi:hypothetical protein
MRYPNRICQKKTSVVDRGCLSRILIFIHLEYNNSNNIGEGKNLLCHLFGCCHKFHKILNYFILNRYGTEQKFVPTDKEIQYFLPENMSLCSQKYGMGIRDTRLRIRKNPIPGSGSATLEKADLYSLLSIFSLLSWTV